MKKSSKNFVVGSLLAVLLVGTSACSHASSDAASTKNQSQTNQSSQNADHASQSNHLSANLQKDSTGKSDNGSDNTNNRSETNHSSTSSTQSPGKNENRSNENNGSRKAFYGQWQIIISAASNPNGETYSTDDWNSLKGKKLTFSKDSATCFGDKIEDMNNTVSNPVYKKTVLSDQDFQTRFRVPLSKLPGIQGNSVAEIDVTGTKGICSTFFKTQYNNMLLLYGGGEFFVLEPPNLTPSDVQAVNEPKGAWVDSFEKKLFKNYHVIPSRYKPLGNRYKGYWEVWVREVNTGKSPYVTVNQKTGDFHG